MIKNSSIIRIMKKITIQKKAKLRVANYVLIVTIFK